MMLLSSTPDSAAEVAKPDLKLCPEKFVLSIPARFKYSFISKATVWSLNLFSDSFEPLVNLLNNAPEFILDISIHLRSEITGQYCEFSKWGSPFTEPSPNWSVFDLLRLILRP